MKTTTPHWIAIAILLTIIVTAAVKFVVLGSSETAPDGRTAVLLNDKERQQVLAEMRSLLAASQQIIEALADGDMERITKAAQPVGSAAIGTMDFQLKAKLPLEFKQLGFATHHAFDAIGTMASEGKPAKEIQRKLADTMNNCVACHASYQLPAPLPR